MLKTKPHIVGLVLIILHLVGVIGFLSPDLKQYFILLTPFNLILSGAALAYFHEHKDKEFWLLSLSVFTLGFVVEMLGVASGVIFGEYYYEGTLGLKVMEVPLVIGLNWWILVYCTRAVAAKLTQNSFAQIVLAAILMVGMDFLIEPVAVRFDYWEWVASEIPIANYIAWFVIGLAMQFIIKPLSDLQNNKIAFYLIGAQLIFFTLLNVF